MLRSPGIWITAMIAPVIEVSLMLGATARLAVELVGWLELGELLGSGE